MNPFHLGKLTLLAAILLASTALPAAAQRGGSTPVACGSVIDEPGNYHLEADLACTLGFPPPAACQTAAITIAAPDVHLNGRGHTISGNRTGVGVRVITNDARVHNLGAESFGIGIEVSGGGGHRLQRVSLRHNSDFHCATGIGILMTETQGNQFRNSVASSNERWGVRIASSAGNLLRGNEITGNRFRTGDIAGNVDLVLARDNRILGNDLSRGGLFGARFQQSQGNVLAMNVIDDTGDPSNFGNFGTAVLLVASDENLIRRNFIDRDPPANVGTRFTGIGLFNGSARNIVEGNRVENHNTGIRLGEGVVEIRVERNTATTNLMIDAQDDNPDCGTNTWEDNVFASTNQSCIE